MSKSSNNPQTLSPTHSLLSQVQIHFERDRSIRQERARLTRSS